MNQENFAPFLWGKPAQMEVSTANASVILGSAKKLTASFSDVPIAKIVDVIAGTGELWRKDGRYFKRAMKILTEELSFSPQMIESTLEAIPGICLKQELQKRIDSEIGSSESLDGFTKADGFEGRIKACPMGVVLHVAAGNVFLGCIDSLLNGFLTKNISLIRLSEKNLSFPLLFAESISEFDKENIISDKFALVSWPSENHDIENIFKGKVDAIVAWGGEEMVRSYRENRGLQTKLVEHGPKISFQVLFKDSFNTDEKKSLMSSLAKDVCMWDQAACSSAQNIFLQDGIDINSFVELLSAELENFPIPPGSVTDDEWVERLKEEYRGLYSELQDTGRVAKGADWLIHVDREPNLRSSPLHRVLIVKRFSDINNLVQQIAPAKGLLQTCGFSAPENVREDFISGLSGCGISRFTPIGKMTEGLSGAPHDGGYLLGELVRWVDDERIETIFNFERPADVFLRQARRVIADHPIYRKIYEGVTIKGIDDLIPVSSGQIFGSYQKRPGEKLNGHIFFSGGTTGKPKTVFYSNEEFDLTASLLAKGFSAQGVGAGTVCANLFVAGGMWSSFLVVDNALNKCGALQLPIGGQTDIESIVSCLSEFKPDVLFGLPTLFTTILDYCLEKEISLEIPALCYAGEHMGSANEELFRLNWKTQKFYSAGYASVDSGPIGYQCAFSGDKEHHVFSSHVWLQEIEGEAVITSLVRSRDPAIHLRTGDRIEWIKNGCKCGSTDPVFKLLGRCDHQINIWGVRIYVEEIERALEKINIQTANSQVVLTNVSGDSAIHEKMTIVIETATPSNPQVTLKLRDQLVEQIMMTNLDLKSHSVPGGVESIDLVWCSPGGIEKSRRTGKRAKVKDLRV